MDRYYVVEDTNSEVLADGASCVGPDGLAYIRFFEVGGDAYAIARCLNRGMVIG